MALELRPRSCDSISVLCIEGLDSRSGCAKRRPLAGFRSSAASGLEGGTGLDIWSAERGGEGRTATARFDIRGAVMICQTNFRYQIGDATIFQTRFDSKHDFLPFGLSRIFGPCSALPCQLSHRQLHPHRSLASEHCCMLAYFCTSALLLLESAIWQPHQNQGVYRHLILLRASSLHSRSHWALIPPQPTRLRGVLAIDDLQQDPRRRPSAQKSASQVLSS